MNMLAGCSFQFGKPVGCFPVFAQVILGCNQVDLRFRPGLPIAGRSGYRDCAPGINVGRIRFVGCEKIYGFFYQPARLGILAALLVRLYRTSRLSAKHFFSWEKN